jgi:hypothetical protein
MSVYRTGDLLRHEEHWNGYFQTDCPHCQNLISMSEEIFSLIKQRGFTIREELVIANSVIELLLHTFPAEPVGEDA